MSVVGCRVLLVDFFFVFIFFFSRRVLKLKRLFQPQRAGRKGIHAGRHDMIQPSLLIKSN